MIDPSTLQPPGPPVTGLECDLNAFSAAERELHAAGLERLRMATQAVEELPNGIALRLKPDDDSLRLSADFIAYERRCCPFFNFSLEVAAGGGPTRLRITGPDGVKALLAEAFAQGETHD